MVRIKTEAEDDTDLSSYGSESDYGSAPKRARYSGGNSNGGSSKSIKSSRINIPDIDPNTYLVSNSRRPTGPRRMKKNDNVSEVVNRNMQFITCIRLSYLRVFRNQFAMLNFSFFPVFR